MKIKVTDKYSLLTQEYGFDLVETVTRQKLEEGEKGFKGKNQVKLMKQTRQ